MTAFRFNRRHYPFNSFRSLLGLAGINEAPTYASLYNGDWDHPNCVTEPETSDGGHGS